MRTILFLSFALSGWSQVFTTGGYINGLSPNVPANNPQMIIVAHGDSITADKGASNYIQVVWGLVNAGQGMYAKVYQRGINGISYNYAWPTSGYASTLTEDAALLVDAYQQPGKTNWLVVFAGTNGLNGSLGNHSAATEYANFKTYIAARIAAGWRAANIVVCTMLPRTGFTDSIRQTFNTSLVGDDGGYGYKLARFDLNANIGAAGQNLNTTYFYDGIHLTTVGQSIAGGIVYGAMYP